MNNQLHYLIICFISLLSLVLILWQHSFLDLNIWTISLFLSLDWASTLSCMVMHFLDSVCSWTVQLPDNQSHPHSILCPTQMIHIPDVLYNSDWTILWWPYWLLLVQIRLGGMIQLLAYYMKLFLCSLNLLLLQLWLLPELNLPE